MFFQDYETPPHHMSVQLSSSVVSDSLQPPGLQHARLPCTSPTLRACSNSCPSSQWCHPAISSSVVSVSSCLQSFPASAYFSHESVLCITWPKYRSFSFSISPSIEYSALIFFRMDWLDLLAVQGTLKSLFPTPQLKSINSSVLSFLYGPTLTSIHDNGKTIALTRWTFVGKIMSLVFNMLPRFFIAFLPRNKSLLISWLHVTIYSDLEPKNPRAHCFHCFPIYLPRSDGTRCHDLHFLNVEFQASFFTLPFHFHQQALQLLFTFCYKDGVIYISDVIEISPGNPDIYFIKEWIALIFFKSCCFQLGCFVCQEIFHVSV